MKKTLFVLCLLLAGASLAATADTSLHIHPTTAQLKAAKPVGNLHCPVTGDKIGGMGAPVTVVYKGQAVHLCCGGCPATFAKDPAKYLALAKKDVPAKK
jgi:YHS domain-containing protein